MRGMTDATSAPASPASPPFAGLTPECVLDALDSVLMPAGLRTDGRLLALNSYENRVYQVGIEDGPPVVAKFYRPARWSDDAILEEHAFVAELAAREIPAVSARAFDGRTLHAFDGFRFSIFERRGGRAPDLDRSDTLEWLGRFIGRIHAVGATQPYVARPVLDINTFGYEPRDYLLAHDFIPDDVRPAYATAVALALEGVEAAFERAGEIRLLRTHGDCHPSNVLWTDAGPHFVDLDDARMGPAVQDLWMLATTPRALDILLEGYEEFGDFDRGQLELIGPLRLMRQIHYAGWIAQRWDDPAFPRAFPFAAEPRWWEQHVQDLLEAAERLNED